MTGSRSLAAGLLALLCGGVAGAVEGIVWQPDNDTVAPVGAWDHLGAHQLLIQWTVVDGLAFIEGTGLPAAPRLPPWTRLAKEPWAREVILGLAGKFDERLARGSVPELAQLSQRIAALPTPLNVVGWYFPVEVDPTWQDAPALAAALAPLPRPLWISAYDSANVGPQEFARQLARWLPPDVGVFFQDGVGVHARDAAVALQYTEALAGHLGPRRVRIIAEAFRPQVGGGFRPATPDELRPQLAAYAGWPVYLFETRYLPPEAVRQLAFPRPGVN